MLYKTYEEAAALIRRLRSVRGAPKRRFEIRRLETEEGVRFYIMEVEPGPFSHGP